MNIHNLTIALSVDLCRIHENYDFSDATEDEIDTFLNNNPKVSRFLINARSTLSRFFPLQPPNLSFFHDYESSDSHLTVFVVSDYTPRKALDTLYDMERELDKIGYTQHDDLISFNLRFA